MLKVTLANRTRPLIPQVIEIAAATAIAVAHAISGWLLLTFAILIIAVSGPRPRSRVFAVLFAAVIVLVVLTGCTEPTDAPSDASRTDGEPWLTAVALGVGAVAGAVVFRLFKPTASADLVRIVMWTTLVFAVLTAVVIGSV